MRSNLTFVVIALNYFHFEHYSIPRSHQLPFERLNFSNREKWKMIIKFMFVSRCLHRWHRNWHRLNSQNIEVTWISLAKKKMYKRIYCHWNRIPELWCVSLEMCHVAYLASRVFTRPEIWMWRSFSFPLRSTNTEKKKLFRVAHKPVAIEIVSVHLLCTCHRCRHSGSTNCTSRCSTESL